MIQTASYMLFFLFAFLLGKREIKDFSVGDI